MTPTDGPAAQPRSADGAERPQERDVGRDRVRALVDSGRARLVEALGPMYYADAHLPGAVNIPPDLVAELAPVLLPDKGEPVVTYCSDAACTSSRIVARRLCDLGYAHVWTYAGGKQDWIAAGLPVDRDDLPAG